MQTLRTVRNFAFVLMLVATFAAMQARLLGYMGQALAGFCSGWEDGDGYDCTECFLGTGFAPDWNASGSCDFSGIEDEQVRLETAADYCDDAVSSCYESCEDEYAQYMATWHAQNWNTSDPCYDALKEPDCWMTWGQPGCSAGPESNWSCDCNAFFFCFC